MTKIETNKAAKPRDNEAQSRKDGTVTTDEGKRVEATSPVIPHGAENVVEDDKNEIFSHDELLKLVGKRQPGDEVYLPTDAEGNLKGTIVDEVGDAGEWFVPAMISQDGEGIVTPSGAPIMKRMNPDTREEHGDSLTRAEKRGEKPAE